mmetsp:Transcript_47091/g.73683  ORF Transcript_47091/g.73683 Transcript_47091/m.73683 type:complete len:189 (+) Transcript_47091:222-788(+)
MSGHLVDRPAEDQDCKANSRNDPSNPAAGIDETEYQRIISLSDDKQLWSGFVELKYSQLSGFGLFASKAIQTGDMILAEKAFIRDDAEWEGHEAALDPTSSSSISVTKAVAKLAKEEQRLFWSFGQAPHYGSKLTVPGVFRTNCIYTETDDEWEERSCMFKMTCRLNHSCLPNAKWQYFRKSQQVVCP